MNDSTKKLFNAPWKAEEYEHGHGAWVLRRSDGFLLAENMAGQDANRLARLPELYDALEQAANEFCEGCLVEHGFIDEEHSYFDLIKNGCILNEKGCKAFPWLKLLQKVRDGK